MNNNQETKAVFVERDEDCGEIEYWRSPDGGKLPFIDISKVRQRTHHVATFFVQQMDENSAVVGHAMGVYSREVRPIRPSPAYGVHVKEAPEAPEPEPGPGPKTLLARLKERGSHVLRSIVKRTN